jgi:hypothetical protein
MTVINPALSMQDSMQELINFSVYPPDTGRFGNDWQAIAAYTRSLDDIAGIELLLSYEPPPAIPTGLVRAVHLPYWVTWLDVWRDEPTAVSRYYPGIDPRELYRYCGGRNSAEIIETQRRLWLHAATLGPAYAVLHIGHVELMHTVTSAPSSLRIRVAETILSSKTRIWGHLNPKIKT